MTSNIPTAFRLNHLDIPSIHKFGIGFDSIFEDIHRLATVAGKDNYPPYNVIQIDEDHYSIELALAGIDKDALDIELDQNQLTISTKKVEGLETPLETKELQYLHKGISNRSFSRSFTLADHVIVTGADMHNGILKVSLERQLPEELKPRKIDISSDK
jgi:molecular chaperone IbpA|tara:strand:+ start:31 stop:504 length:474 start_codon:yes stop_codon:yes gene_type:complete